MSKRLVMTTVITLLALIGLSACQSTPEKLLLRSISNRSWTAAGVGLAIDNFEWSDGGTDFTRGAFSVARPQGDSLASFQAAIKNGRLEGTIGSGPSIDSAWISSSPDFALGRQLTITKVGPTQLRVQLTTRSLLFCTDGSSSKDWAECLKPSAAPQ
ncbi:MAG TPA: hypothetical protein VH144_02965 [Candidatus Saccharimonadales bacterium]|jgi:hypothetical protein|nr:hypothetical protein [Candidatus Saccharimonadales bacterium]